MTQFVDTKKVGTWFLRRFEDAKVRPLLLRLVPRFVETYHLTLMTILWSVGIVTASYFAGTSNIHWLWLSSFFIACQYVTDLLDGAVGRLRNTGLVKWGYYMDHFLDYIFFSSIILGYAFIFPLQFIYVFILIALVQIGFMINIFLVHNATEEFSISFLYFGPTEVRLAYILFNTYLIFFSQKLPTLLMPYFAALMIAALIAAVYVTQKKLWKIDMEVKSGVRDN